MSLLRLCKKPPISLPSDATVMDAIKVMVEERIGAIAVTDLGKLKGIFTERDVMKKVVLPGMDPNKTTLEKVMTTEIKSVADTDSVPFATNVMRKHQIRHLFVTNEGGDLEGIVSLRNLLYDIVDDLQNQTNSLEAYITADGMGG